MSSALSAAAVQLFFILISGDMATCYRAPSGLLQCFGPAGMED
jgi:hypothetical protein